MTYDENGRFKVGGAYDHRGRKTGYDAADMKNGISDTSKGYSDNPQYLGHENDYLKNHPVSTGKSDMGHHQGTGHDSDMASNHGGHRTVNDVRTDIRHGLNIHKANGTKEFGGLLSAERIGYNARKHHYVKAEHEAFMKTPAGRTKAANDARDAQPKKSLWDSDLSKGSLSNAPASKAAPAPAEKKRSSPKNNNDSLAGAVKHVIGKLRKK
jgi:hypothetical protein